MIALIIACVFLNYFAIIFGSESRLRKDALTKIDGLYVEVHDFAGLGPDRGMAVNFNKISDKMKAWGRSVQQLQADCMLVY